VSAGAGLVLLSKPGCHLCHEMKAAIAPLLSELGLALREEDVRDDPEHRARFARDIPVLLWNGAELARHRISPDELRARLGPLLAAAGDPG
jgi:glutaredoxin